MFEILPNPSLETMALAARAILLAGAFWVFALAFARWRRADERQTRALQDRFEQAFSELRSLHETVSVMNARIEALGERTESQVRLAPATITSAQRGYDLAARLVRNGATAEELVASCGITRHEAELLARLHAAKTRESLASDAEMGHMNAKMSGPASAAAASRKRGSLLSVVS
ncbi:hypothetical protein ACG33_05815 [Steroidobacter denitrificans]|uniref:DUF2802 domain-containing protein n=1 Tax=Steroidobacter denitrificans TaxID=465721 RepID=A0A127FAH2_STEDE|nr:DUF2802 domain-containing protein [Steroidobacter denitrificans]AMN46621.1 hypothetical protein ACG33_05815 [Steroidobacter denitrificans]